MSLPPDAAALLGAFLDRPTDETPRLVLADWLDDTGLPENAAWAGYLRARCQPASPADADRHAAGITTTLTVPAHRFVVAPDAFLDLLPVARLVVEIGTMLLPREFLEVVPESVARTNRVVPLSPWGDRLYLAAADPDDAELAQRLEFILNRPIVFVRALAHDIDHAIDLGYPFTETESVTEELLIFPDPPPRQLTDAERTQVTADFVDLQLTEAVRRGASWVELRPESVDTARVWFRIGDEWRGRDTLARRRLVAVVNRLADAAGLAPRHDGTFPGSGLLDRVVDGVPTRFTVVIEPTAFGPWVGIEVAREPAAAGAAP